MPFNEEMSVGLLRNCALLSSHIAVHTLSGSDEVFQTSDPRARRAPVSLALLRRYLKRLGTQIVISCVLIKRTRLYCVSLIS